jgi:hypothetical protein
MRKCSCLSLFIAFVSIATFSKCLAQAAPGDSSSQQHAFNNAVILYNSSIGNQSPLFNGPEYFFYDPLIKGNAYFMDVNGFTPGAVSYDGAYHTGVPMLYDLYSDAVVVLLYNHFSKYTLLKEKVKNFDFLDHHFININADTIAGNSGIKSGYYDELYHGKSTVLVKRAKSIQNSTGGTGVEKYFDSSKELYLKKGNTYYSVTSQSSLLNILKDKKKELQQYIRTSQIKFRSNPEQAMVEIATYYDHLTN